jgi:micrococcal nuclease
MNRSAFRRGCILMVGLVAVLPVVLAGQPQPPLIPKPDASQPAYKVIRVIDGDTVVIDLDGKQTSVRFIGVDTPETVHPSKPVEFFGKEASNFTKTLLTGQSVYLQYDQDRTDKYGRTLAYVFRAPDGLFVNLEIVKQGYGHAYTKYPFKHMELFRQGEKHARESGKGLWGEKGNPPQKVDNAKPVVGTGQVFVTNSGKKYHVAGCRYLSKSMIPISLEDARKRFEPCSVCNPSR